MRFLEKAIVVMLILFIVLVTVNMKALETAIERQGELTLAAIQLCKENTEQIGKIVEFLNLQFGTTEEKGASE